MAVRKFRSFVESPADLTNLTSVVANGHPQSLFYVEIPFVSTLPRHFRLSSFRIHHAVAVAAVALSLAVANSASATIVSASSSGYGLDVDVRALGLHLDVGPLPTGVSGTAPSPYNVPGSVTNLNVTSNIPVVVGGAVTASAVNASAFSNVNNLPGSRTTSASGGVVGAGVSLTTLPVIPPGVNLLGLNATLSSTAQISGDFGSLLATGTTTITNLGLTINGIPLNLSAYVNVPIAPNTSVNLAALGVANATLILNEQIIAPDNSSITVNALRLNLNLVNLITGSVTMGHSQAQVLAAVPEAGSMSLCGAAFCGGAALWQRRRKADS